MNFLNDSLKTLKNVLAEGLEQQVNFEGDETDQAQGDSDKDNLRKLCQHQSEEVNSQCFYYCAVLLYFSFVNRVLSNG